MTSNPDPEEEARNTIDKQLSNAGCTATIEKHDADLYVDMGNTELAVEIAMRDNPREIEHVEKHLDRGFTVWVVCRNIEVQEGLRQRLEEDELLSDCALFRRFEGSSISSFQ